MFVLARYYKHAESVGGVTVFVASKAPFSNNDIVYGIVSATDFSEFLKNIDQFNFKDNKFFNISNIISNIGDNGGVAYSYDDSSDQVIITYENTPNQINTSKYSFTFCNRKGANDFTPTAIPLIKPHGTIFEPMQCCEHDIFRQLCLGYELMTGTLTWRFLRHKIHNQERLDQIRNADSEDMFADQIADISNPHTLQCVLECFINSDLTMLNFNDQQFYRTLFGWFYTNQFMIDHAKVYKDYRHKIYKLLWKMLFDEEAVGNQMADKIDEAVYRLRMPSVTYDIVKKELARQFGSAGEGGVMGIGKLLSGRDKYDVKAKNRVVTFSPYRPSLSSEPVNQENQQRSDSQLKEKFIKLRHSLQFALSDLDKLEVSVFGKKLSDS